MNGSFFMRCVPLLVLLLLAAATDLRNRKIPNWLTLLLILGGIAQSFFASHLAGPGSAVIGVLAGAAIPFLLFAMGALGAGDVKLMAGVGAWLGPVAALMVFIIAAIVGMIIVIVQAVVEGRLQLLTQNSLAITLSLLHIREVGSEHVTRTGQSARSLDKPLPYAVPVMIATCAVFLARWR
jgi:prepilin peptidase CpaA